MSSRTENETTKPKAKQANKNSSCCKASESHRSASHGLDFQPSSTQALGRWQLSSQGRNSAQISHRKVLNASSIHPSGGQYSKATHRKKALVVMNLSSGKHSASALGLTQSSPNHSAGYRGKKKKRKTCCIWTYPADPEQTGLVHLQKCHCLREEEEMLRKVSSRGRCRELG